MRIISAHYENKILVKAKSLLSSIELVKIEIKLRGKEMGHQDYQNPDFEQNTIEIVKDREKVEMFYDSGYWPVLAILREGPMTVREITKKSNELIEKKEGPKLEEKIREWEIPTEKESLKKLLMKISSWEEQKVKEQEKSKKEIPEKDRFKQFFTKDKIDKLLSAEKLSDIDKKHIKKRTYSYKLENVQKSDKTIYRYIKELTDAGLIVESGKRVIFGQTASESLYSRSAKMFLLRQHSDDTWKCDECKKTLSKVGKLLGLSMKIDPPEEESLSKLMSAIDNFHEEEQIRLFEQYEDKVKDVVKDCSFKESNRILEIFKILYLMMNVEEFNDEIKACFK